MKLSWMVRGNLKYVNEAIQWFDILLISIQMMLVSHRRDRKQIDASKRFFTISVGGSSVPPSFVTDAAVGMSEPTST